MINGIAAVPLIYFIIRLSNRQEIMGTNQRPMVQGRTLDSVHPHGRRSRRTSHLRTMRHTVWHTSPQQGESPPVLRSACRWLQTPCMMPRTTPYGRADGRRLSLLGQAGTV